MTYYYTIAVRVGNLINSREETIKSYKKKLVRYDCPKANPEHTIEFVIHSLKVKKDKIKLPLH